MLTQESSHPPHDHLVAFGQGRLDPETARRIEGHVRDCEACCQALLAAPDDDLTVQLRGAALPSEEQPPALGDHPRYRLLRLLGRGGMGAVYLAEHVVMSRLVALKVLNRDRTAGPLATERFLREARCAARLRHPNIVAVYDAERGDDCCFLVMEYVEGVSLDRLLKERGALPAAQACDYVRQAALGLQHAHDQGMVHRDVKPANLILRPDGTVQVLDFGLVGLAGEEVAAAPGRATTVERRLTRTSAMMGTPDYMAPEQAAGAHAADARSDVYALGCTLHELLTGRVPFPDGLGEEVPAELRGLLSRMLAHLPAERVRSAGEVAAALTPFTSRRRWRRPGRREALAALSVAVAVGLVAAARSLRSKPRRLVFHEARRLPVPHRVGRLSLSPDGRRLLLGILDNNVSQLWDLATGERRAELATYVPLFTSDGLHFVGIGTRELHLFDARTGRLLRPFARHQRETLPWGLTLSPDDRLVYALNSDGVIRVVRIDTGVELKAWPFTRYPENSGFLFTPEPRRVMVRPGPYGPWEGWDIEQGKECDPYPNLRDKPRLNNFLATGEVLAVDEMGQHVLDAATGATRRTIPLARPRTRLLTHVLSQDRRHTLTADSGGVVRLYDLSAGGEIASIEVSTDTLNHVALSADSSSAAAVVGDEVVVWRLVEG
ncbi:MAG: WD40 repeat domain-containing serine/threonine protein kinase [Gemmataceae bacterium]